MSTPTRPGPLDLNRIKLDAGGGKGDEEEPPNLYCWGRTQDGQAGPATSDVDHVLVVQVPTPIGALSGVRVVRVSCGSRHTLALDDKGHAYSWGWGLCGQLGHGDCPAALQSPRLIQSLAPTPPQGNSPGFPGIKTLSAGGIHSAAIDLQGRVYTWGEASYGQLGTGHAMGKQSRATPEQVFIGRARGGEDLRAVQISCGGMHTAAVTSAGLLYCWGRADNGQLGIGRSWLEASDPASSGVVTPALVSADCFDAPVKQVSCGAFHTAVVTTSGMVFTWGREEHGMLGHDVSADSFYDALDRPKPVENMAQIKGARMVSCGGWHTSVVTEDGRLFSCGRGEYGRLGFGEQKSVTTLTEVQGFETTMAWLKGWLIFVASLRVLSVVFGYFMLDKIKDNVFTIAPSAEVTALVGRTFAIWTTTSCTITMACAFNLHSRPLYLATMATFLIALVYFALEVLVYHTVAPKAAISPGVVASLSLLFMSMGLREPGGPKAKLV